MMRLSAVLFLMLMSATANAVCYHDGVAYQTGERIGQYVCAADGTWQRL